MPHYVTLMRWTSQGVAGLPAWRERVEEGERMKAWRLGWLAVAAVLIAGPAQAAGPAPRLPDSKKAKKADDEALRVANRIDDYIAARLQTDNVKPAPITHDAAFLRRVR